MAEIPSIPGKANATTRTLGDDKDLFLKVFAGEILTAFNENNIMKDLTMVRSISNGKSASFPVTGTASAGYHTPGDSLITGDYLSQIAHNERQIFIDQLLVSSTLIAEIDELRNHYDLRSIYSKELGKSLAKECDINIIKTFIAAANESATAPQGAGSVLDGGDLVTAEAMVNALFAVAETLDGKDVPSEDRFAVMAPQQYYKLLTADNVAINKDTSNGGADVAKGVVMEVAGIKIYKSNNLQTVVNLGNLSGAGDTVAGQLNDVFGAGGTGYNGDFSGITANADSGHGFIAGHPSAVGTVKLLDLATESEYQIERQATLFAAKYAMGHGVLRPEAAVVVKTT
tara:strand:- start:4090 stop:5118 length:1029 start_codon:yes stop_codon:yes gene_type:complete